MTVSILATVASVWGKAWPILFAIVFFGLIIFSHEVGHFTAAKLFRVKVNKFALGMGPSILKKKKGETEYSVRLFPIGGFVLMEGEDEESADSRSYSRKPVWQRMIIISAGAIVNLIVGLLIVALMLSLRATQPTNNLIGTPQINRFYQNASTKATGLMEGDVVKKINGRRVFSDYDMNFLLSRNKDDAVDFVVERGGVITKVDGVKFDTAERNGETVMVFDFILVGIDLLDLSWPQRVSALAKYSTAETVSIARIVWVSLFDLVTGRYGFRDISGPIGTVGYIVEVTTEVTNQASQKADLSPILTMLALISVNIGIFNLLPVPALDGGKLFFLFIELIRRKPVNQKYEGWIHAVGLALLLLFMLVISFSDILKLVRGQM